MFKTSKFSLLLIGLALILAACGGNGSDTISDSDKILTQAAQLVQQSGTETAAAMPAATDTPEPPTDTPEPTATPTNGEVPTNALSADLTATAEAGGGEGPTLDPNAPTATATIPPIFTPTSASGGNTGGGNNNNSGSCKYAAFFEGVETIPDGTTYPYGKAFTKTWRVKNTGTCTWDGQLELRWFNTLYEGEEVAELFGAGSVTKIIDTETVSPGGYLEVKVDLIVPQGNPGKYRLNFYLTSPNGWVPLNGNAGGFLYTEINTTTNE
jgi:hypothetical protein